MNKEGGSNGNPKASESRIDCERSGGRPREGIFRWPLEDSSLLTIKFPVTTRYATHEENKLSVDMSSVPCYLNLSYRGRTRLAKLFVIARKFITERSRHSLDYQKLALKYQNLIDKGTCVNRAGVARYFGVSRAWVTKVMRNGNGLKLPLP